MLTIFAGIAEFERSLLLSRCNEGRAVAVSKGVVMGRPRRGGSQMEFAIELYKDKALNKMSMKDICSSTGISKATLCRRISEIKEISLTSMSGLQSA